MTVDDERGGEWVEKGHGAPLTEGHVSAANKRPAPPPPPPPPPGHENAVQTPRKPD